LSLRRVEGQIGFESPSPDSQMPLVEFAALQSVMKVRVVGRSGYLPPPVSSLFPTSRRMDFLPTSSPVNLAIIGFILS